MKPIIAVMLCLQAAIFLVTVCAVVFRKPTPAKPRPVWMIFGIALLIVGTMSMRIATRNDDAAGAEILLLFGPLLIGMALMSFLISVRSKREFDTP